MLVSLPFLYFALLFDAGGARVAAYRNGQIPIGVWGGGAAGRGRFGFDVRTTGRYRVRCSASDLGVRLGARSRHPTRCSAFGIRLGARRPARRSVSASDSVLGLGHSASDSALGARSRWSASDSALGLGIRLGARSRHSASDSALSVRLGARSRNSASDSALSVRLGTQRPTRRSVQAQNDRSWLLRASSCSCAVSVLHRDDEAGRRRDRAGPRRLRSRGC